MKKILAIAMVLGVFGVIMGGCSKGSEESGSTAGTAGSTAGTAGSTAGTAGSTADTTTK